MAQITYANKVALNENPEIAAINKVSDDDMNEIKQVVNDNYNNTIQITDTEPTDSDNKLWIDTSSLSQSDNTNMKYNDNGTYKDIYVKTFDTLPVGAIVEYSGSTIPSGWTDIGNNQIQKTSQYIEGGAGLPSYFTDEIDTGMKWIDGKPIYRKVINFGALPNATTKKVAHNLTNYNCIKLYGIAILGENSLPLPYVNEDNFRILLDINTDGVRINTFSTDRSSYNGYIVVEYTKTTD